MDEKLVDLETRIAFLEDSQQKLSDIVARQERDIERMLRRINDLEEQLRQAVPALVADADDETPPPHY